jgi:hypothetical protein
MTAVVITPSLDRTWVKPLSTLRARGVACVVVSFDDDAFEHYADDDARRRHGLEPAAHDAEVAKRRHQEARALRHALAEFDVTMHTVVPGRPLGELLAG